VGLQEFSGFLLGNSFSASNWIHEISSASREPVSLFAPFVFPKASRGSLLIWPFEESAKIQSGRQNDSSWVETSSLSKSAVLATAKRASQLAAERGAELFWVNSGWGGQEDFAYQTSLEVVTVPMPILTMENFQSSLLGASEGRKVILLSVARTAIPVARLLRAQGWIACASRGTGLVQAWGALGPSLCISYLLDHLGYVAEAETIEREAILAGDSNV
jgi:hypothetical protein